LELGKPVPDVLADARVKREDGSDLRLGDLWKKSDTLLVFVRHFACAGCSEHVTELSPRLGELHDLGVKTVIVGCGRPEHIQGFVERQRLAGKRVLITTDATLAAHEAAGMVRSMWGTLGPVAVLKMLGAMTRGHDNGRTEGDLYQMGGTLLVLRSGELAFHHRAETLGEHAPLVDVVDVVLRLRAQDAAASFLP
jgi:peroxiredoxin